MPYIIAVIALVVASVGFTLFQSSNNPVADIQSEPIVMEVSNDTSAPTPTDTARPVNTGTPNTALKNTPTVPPAAKTPSTPTPQPTPTPTPVPVNTSHFKNGTYRAQSSYRTPGGSYLMQVTFTVANDKITAADVAFDGRGANDGYSRSFSDSYQNKVIGQSLETVRPSRIGGASLTTNAFNNALASIKTQAS